MNRNNDDSAENINTVVDNYKEGVGLAIRGSDMESEGVTKKKKGRVHRFTTAIQAVIKKSQSLFFLISKRPKKPGGNDNSDH